MGAVYKIEHVITKRIEAMKLLPGGLPADPEQEQRFEREMQVQARLQHPNIAALYNAVRDGQTMALVMEYVEGESLQRMLEDGPLPLKTAVEFAGQVLSALAYAHRAGVIHRDVAPGNIIITPNRTAKLTDFGLARAKTDLRVTTSGAPVGSFWYMSPEQVRGLEPIDGRTDIYALGAVLYEMLTGTKLFQADGAFAIMSAHVDTPPQPPSARLPGIPPAMDAIVLKALAKDRTARFQNADEFRLALIKALPGMAPAGAPRRHVSRLAAVMAMLPAVVVGCVAMAVGVSRYQPKPVPVHAARDPKPATPAVGAAQGPTPADTPAVADTQPTLAISAPAAPPPVSAARPTAPASTLPPATPVQPATHPAQSVARPPKRPARSYAIRVTGGELETPAPAAPASPPAPTVTAAAPEPVVALPTPAITLPATAPEPPAAADDPNQAKSQKNGNRLVRALGKINPFHKNTKQ